MAKENGEFSIKNAYDMISKRHPTNVIFKIIWKLNVPERVRIFIWQIAHYRIHTRDWCSRWFGSSRIDVMLFFFVVCGLSTPGAYQKNNIVNVVKFFFLIEL